MSEVFPHLSEIFEGSARLSRDLLFLPLNLASPPPPGRQFLACSLAFVRNVRLIAAAYCCRRGEVVVVSSPPHAIFRPRFRLSLLPFFCPCCVVACPLNAIIPVNSKPFSNSTAIFRGGGSPAPSMFSNRFLTPPPSPCPQNRPHSPSKAVPLSPASLASASPPASRCARCRSFLVVSCSFQPSSSPSPVVPRQSCLLDPSPLAGQSGAGKKKPRLPWPCLSRAVASGGGVCFRVRLRPPRLCSQFP